MSWIEKNGVRYFRFTKTVGRRVNKYGKEVPVRREFYGRTRKEAEQKYQDFMKKTSAGMSTDTNYFGIIADTWIEDFFLFDTSLKGGTRAQYLKNWNRLIKTAEFYNFPLTEISPKTIQQHYNTLFSKGIPSDAIRLTNLMMKRFYKYVEAEGYGRNITASITIPKDNKVPSSRDVVVWTDEEISKILGGFDRADSRFRFRFLIVIAYYTGCRIGEILGLKYDDIVNNTLTVCRQHSRDLELHEEGDVQTIYAINTPKTSNSIRKIPLHENVMKELSIHKAWHMEEQLKNEYRTDFVFTTSSGLLYDPTNIRTALNRYYKRIGVEPKTIHTYRHTFGTNLCRQNVPIQTACKLLGHDNISTTAKYYINVSLPEKEAAIASLPLPEANGGKKVGKKSGKAETPSDLEQIKKLETIEISSLVAPPLGIEPRTNL